MSLNVDLIPRGQEKPKSLLCANEFRIPDLVLLQGRILVHSFDWDLNGTDEQAVHILHKAVHVNFFFLFSIFHNINITIVSVF